MISYRSEFRQARGGVKGAVDLGTAPGGIVCAAGVDPTLLYRRIYGAFWFQNCTFDCKIQFRGMFQGTEVFVIEASISSQYETLPSTTPNSATTRGWLPFAIETQPVILGTNSTIPAPANAIRLCNVYSSATDFDFNANVITASPFDLVGKWDRIEARLVSSSGAGCMGNLGTTTFAEVWIACASSNIKP